MAKGTAASTSWGSWCHTHVTLNLLYLTTGAGLFAVCQWHSAKPQIPLVKGTAQASEDEFAEYFLLGTRHSLCRVPKKQLTNFFFNANQLQKIANFFQEGPTGQPDPSVSFLARRVFFMHYVACGIPTGKRPTTKSSWLRWVCQVFSVGRQRLCVCQKTLGKPFFYHEHKSGPNK